ncbi:MAG: hypothetical protein HOP02_08150 [Methylococcaceae bacterium]|nr:hypothetical protein [Methylococcaceae bacterium]
MPNNSTPLKRLSDDLRLPWMITWGMALLLLGYLAFAYIYGAKLSTDFSYTEVQRINLRTVLYWVAILTLPLTNLIRHIQLRLNQTMPTATPAKSRYCLTVLVSMLLCESIALYGLLLFCLGDGFNTLIIFMSLSALGLFLYRPKLLEYRAVVAALAEKHLARSSDSI